MAEIVGTAIISAAFESSAVAAAVSTTTVVGSVSVASVVGGAALLAGTAGLSLVSGALAEPQKVAAQQFASRQPVPPRQRSYGRVKLGGAYVQYKAFGGAFYYGLYHGEGPWDAIEEWFADDLRTNLLSGSLGGIVTVVPWRNYVGVESHLGEAVQAASSILLPSAGWDANHFLHGCAYSAVKSTAPEEKRFKKFFPKGTFPALRVVARASKVRIHADPAQTTDPATWKWTDLAAPCIRDFLTHDTWGMRVPVSLINEVKFDAAASLCAEVVINKAGEAHPRYFLGGTYQLTDDPADVLKQMLAAGDFALTLESDGTIGITGGRPPVATVVLTDDDVLSLQIEGGASKLAAFNRLKITYVSPLHDYQQVEGQAWNDASAQAASGELLEEDFSRPWVQNFNQVRRLAKIAMAKGNPAFKLTGTFKLSAAAALFEEAVRFNSATYPMFAGFVFQVSRAVANIAAGTVTLELASIDPAAYVFDAQTEEGTPPALPNTTAIEAPPAPPANLTVSIERRAVNGTTTATFLRMKASPTTRADLSLIGRYRMVGDQDFATMVADTDDRFSLISQVLVDGASYEAQGAIGTYGQGLVSDYVNAMPDPITAVADDSPPDPPRQGTAEVSGRSIRLGWVTGGTANYAATRVYRSNNSGPLTLVATIPGAPNATYLSGFDPYDAGQYRFFFAGLNGSGVESQNRFGPIDVTVT